MKREDARLSNPPKLVELPHAYAALIERGNREYEAPLEETERFCRKHPRPSRPPRRGAMALAPIAVAAAVLLALGIGVVMRSGDGSRRAVKAEAPSDVSTEHERERKSPVVAQPTGVALGAGARKLSDGSVVNLSPGSSARVSDRGKNTSVVLDAGELTLAVEPRAAGEKLEVLAGAYRFEVIGTRFSVTRSGDAVALRVDEGRVAVYGEKGELATVSAGGAWSTPGDEPPAAAPPVAPSHSMRSPETDATSRAADAPRPDCRDLARRGEPERAEACYLERSSGSGLEAETALFEVARLRRDVLADPIAALEALENYRRRFPDGSLRSEADLAYVVLLTRIGRHHEALTESQRLLDSPKGRERAFELRLLRGNIQRKGLGNVALAAEEYAKAEALDASSSEATYLLGSCLEEFGSAEAARKAYRRYLDKAPSGKRASEVRERLGRLLP